MGKMVSWKRLLAASAVFAVLFSLLIPLGQADRGILPITDVDVYGPGQKAIVAWNGRVERLALSTDLYASAETKVLEVLPLPSEPSVEEGSFESFHAVQELMMKNMPRAAVPEYKGGLEIVFHERIGAHDITVVKAASVEELSGFMLNYTRNMGVAQPSITERTRQILSDYLARGFNYWAFDLVDLYSSARSVEPIVYEFRSSSLYYPLKVSATAKGRTEVILYVITAEPISEEAIPTRMRLARYLPSDQAIQFRVSHDELATIEKGIASLFGPMPLVYPPYPAAWFTAVKYEGDLSDLDFDFEVPPRPIHPCRAISVGTDRTEYDVREMVKITVDFTHLLPGCVEVTVIHFHQVRVEVLDSSGNQIESWQWQTESSLHKTVTWKPEKADDYAIRASSWWQGQNLEVEHQTQIKVSGVTPPVPTPSSEARWLLYGVIIAVVCVLIGAGLTYLLLRSKLAR